MLKCKCLILRCWLSVQQLNFYFISTKDNDEIAELPLKETIFTMACMITFLSVVSCLAITFRHRAALPKVRMETIAGNWDAWRMLCLRVINTALIPEKKLVIAAHLL